MIQPARTVFCPPRFTPVEVEKIFAAAQGRCLYFSRSEPQNVQTNDLGPYLLCYARGEDWKAGLPVSRRRFYQVLKSYREPVCPERVLAFQREGLTLRQLARLFKTSTSSIQRYLDEVG